ncbi:hypothetical protein H9Q73_005635 [Fusarium xylarioides]|nr:hypothetical protein H9Q73_005635 [Fusarium xylarioides]
MDRIFREAKHVLCWLGKDDNTVAEDCFRFIRDTRISMEQEFQPEWTMGNLLNSLRSLGSNESGLYKEQNVQEHAICAVR